MDHSFSRTGTSPARGGRVAVSVLPVDVAESLVKALTAADRDEEVPLTLLAAG
jgi:hypothetical protein